MPVRIPRNERGKILVVLFFSILGSLSGFACRCRMVEFLSFEFPPRKVRFDVSKDMYHTYRGSCVTATRCVYTSR